ncbi:signal peptidase I [Vagococcus elongatus]|uniref:Signal peptidase I n=1 Tax=Vagococcus elongatus TaxID=180344 RepID=A0A430B0Z9_9ENTE|nr:signal peptidase I [Vagococcus elongatus]RSU13986.1 signal peptidase I [Vagococcus elongatus]
MSSKTAASIPQKNNNKQKTILQEIVFILFKAGLLLGIFVLLFTFVFGVVRVADASMHPSVREGDIVFFYRHEREFSIGDVIVLRSEEENQVRRIVAKPFDQVDITEMGLEVNGHPQIGLEKSYIIEQTNQFVDGVSLPLTLKEDEFFVLGDSREQSEDSRIYGPVKAADIQGGLMAVIRRRNF